MEAKMRGRMALALAVSLVGLLLPVGHAAASGGGNIASATTVSFGKHEFGNTSAGKFEGCYPATYWNLPLQAGDQVTIDWETPSHEYAYHLHVFPAGTTDFSINNVSPLETFGLGSNNQAESVFSVGASGVYPILFHGECGGTGGPVDFTAVDQHELVTALKPYAHLRTNTIVTGTASLGDGSPVPDGLSFALNVTWPGGSSTYSALSGAGGLTFPLALPESAIGKVATFTITRPADATYLATKSTSLKVKISSPVAPSATPCEEARARAHVLARQFRRLSRNAARAHGARRHHLQRRKRKVKRKLDAARAGAAQACATA